MADSSASTTILSGSEIAEVISTLGLDAFMDMLISRIEDAFKTYNTSETEIPIRAGFNYTKPDNGLIEWMPLYQHGDEVILKVVGYHPNNPVSYSIPTILSTVSAYDTKSGHLTALVDGVLLTALRTGAASAVASKYLADPKSNTLGLIGCGAQSITQLHAISRVFDLKRVLYYDIDDDTMSSFEARAESLNLNVTFEPMQIHDIVTQCDILCTATSIAGGDGPLFENISTRDHLHINAVGSDFPGKTELPLEFLNRAVVCPDFRAQAAKEGECQQMEPSAVGPSIDEIIQSWPDHNSVQTNRTVFDSTGWALEDRVAMHLLLELAEQLDIGIKLAIEDMQGDSKDPYSGIAQTSIQRVANLNALLTNHLNIRST